MAYLRCPRSIYPATLALAMVSAALLIGACASPKSHAGIHTLAAHQVR
jgi:hypothetical protein